MASSLFSFSLVLTLLFLVSRVEGLQCRSNTTNALNDYAPEPSSLNDGIHSLVTVNATEARVAALCHVTCINYFLRSLSGGNGGGNSSNSTTPGPTATPSPTPGEEPSEEPMMMMPGVYTFSSCSDQRKYHDCRTGCIAESENDCGACQERCQDICQFRSCDLPTLVPGNDCGAQCDVDDCNAGCQCTLPSDELTKPSAPPVLTSMSNTPLFDVEIPLELEMYENPSVLFRIEYRPGTFVYQWMVDFMMPTPMVTTIADFVVDLSRFPGGSRINVSFAYVTEESGLSPYSDPTDVQLPGCSVSRLTEDQVSITSELDTRAGFFNHPVLNVTWCPTSCPEGVLNYTVTRTNCVEEVSETVISTTSSVLLRSKSLVFFDRPCNMRVEVKTILADGNTFVVDRIIVLPIPHKDAFPELQVSCPVTYDREEEKYMLDFQLTVQYTPATLSNIQVFVIRRDSLQKPQDGARDPTPVVLSLFRENIIANVNQRVYRLSQLLQPFTVGSRFYRTSVEVLWKEGNGLPGLSTNCEVDGVDAPPPLPISVINIVNIDTGRVIPALSGDYQDVEATVMFDFEKPEVLFSESTPLVYQFYFGLDPLGPTDEQQEVTTISQLGDVVLQTFNVPKENDTVVAYLQIRSYQFNDFESHWSEPKRVEIVVLGVPEKVDDLEVKLTKVDVEHRQLGAYVLLTGDMTWTWEDDDLPKGTEVDHYNVRIGEATSQQRNRTFALDEADFLLPEDFSKNIEFDVSVQVSWRGETQTSPSKTVTKRVRPLAPPQITTITALNPRLETQGSLTVLSANVTVNWAQPNIDNAAHYEIKVTTANSSRAFDEFSKSHDSTAPSSTQLTKNFREIEDDPDNPQILVQMRSMVENLVNEDTISLPRWSDPRSISLDVSPPPEIVQNQLLSFSLVSDGDRFSLNTSLNLTWEEVEESEELESYEVWVGSRALGEFEQLDNDDSGEIFIFPVNNPSANSTRENITSENSTENSTITEMISAQFFSESARGVVHIQIRSVSMSKVPKWSTPSEIHERQASLPPVNIIVVGTPEINRDEKKNIIDVKVELEWELPMVLEEEEPEIPAVTSSIILTFPSSSFAGPFPSPSLFPSPSPSPEERNKRQIEGDESESGSGMGLGSGDDTTIPRLSGNITAIYAYMGKTVLSTYAPRPEENVVRFKADELSGTVPMEFPIEEKEEFTLFVQMQIERHGGFPTWSDPIPVPLPPPTTGPPTGGVRGTEGTDPTLAITLSVVGAVILVLIIAIVIVLCCVCYNKRQYKIISDGREDMLEIYSRPGLTGLYTGKGPILDEWEISTDDVIVDELLGEGAFGEVYKGVIRGPLENPKISAVLRQAIGVPVAIKLLKTTSAGKEKADFLAEIDMMKKIAEGYNTHIVNMVGCVTLQEPLCLITEFIPYGDLISYLKHQRKKRSEARRRGKLRQQQELEQRQTSGGESYEAMTAPGEGGGGGRGYEAMSTGGGGGGYESTTTGGGDGYDAPKPPSPTPYLEPSNAYSHLEPKTEDLDEMEEDKSHYKDLGDIEPDDLIRFAYQIASGMEYLASLNIVHRDLACRNVLIANDKLLKITDFGLSREVQEVYVKKTKGRLPLKWMAIESITAREFTTASDVWAFGVTLYEIGTIGGFPYPSINNEDLLRMLSQGYRLEKPDNCSAEVYDLMLQCWQEDPQDRLSFSQLRSQFSAMLQAGSAQEYIDLQINEEAPYYQMRDEDMRERSDSASSGSSEGSIDSLNKQKITKEKKKLKRKRTNPYVPTPQQQQEGGQGEAGAGEDGYIPMESAGSAMDRPIQLGIPISQLMPSNDHQPTPVEDAETPLDIRRTNPYVSEPSEILDGSLVASSVPLVVTTNGAMSVRDSALEFTESTHL